VYDTIRKNSIKSKKGVSAWISWVLLVAFMVSLSAFMYTFLSGFTKDSIEDVKEKVIDSKVCDSVGVSVSACLKNSNLITVTIKNVNYITVDKVSIDMFDVFDRPQQKTKEFKLVSGNLKKFDILKDGIIKEIHVVPAIYKDGKAIYCSNKEVGVYDISSCS
jgi:hypothetical protein